MELDEKSEQSMEAANVLIQNGHATESIHCLYYACYQMLLSKIDELFDKDERKRKKEYDAYVFSKGIRSGKVLGSHEYWIDYFLNNANREYGVNFFRERNQLIALKDSRASADYSTIVFSEESASQKETIAEKIINKIKSITA